MDSDLIGMFIKKIDFLSLEKVFNNAIEAQKYILDNEIDLIISDIMLPDITGLEMIKTLKNPPQVIFTTSFPDFAVDGFELSAADYLVKPIRFERFLKAINRAWEMHKSHDAASSSQKTGQEPKNDHFFIRSEFSFIKIFYNDIIYIQSVKDYVRIVTAAESHLTAMNLIAIEEKLPKTDFIRIHRSLIINQNKIEALKNNEVTVGGHLLSLGKNYRDSVYEAVVNNKILKR